MHGRVSEQMTIIYLKTISSSSSSISSAAASSLNHHVATVSSMNGRPTATPTFSCRKKLSPFCSQPNIQITTTVFRHRKYVAQVIGGFIHSKLQLELLPFNGTVLLPSFESTSLFNSTIFFPIGKAWIVAFQASFFRGEHVKLRACTLCFQGSQLMVYCWFGARRFGFLQSPKMKGIVTWVYPYNPQTTGTQTKN